MQTLKFNNANFKACRGGFLKRASFEKVNFVLLTQWVSFWIKPEAAPARVTLGVTSLLTLSTQHAKSQASLPPVSYLKAVDAFMSACTV